jgi:hypothetical protein
LLNSASTPHCRGSDGSIHAWLRAGAAGGNGVRFSYEPDAPRRLFTEDLEGCTLAASPAASGGGEVIELVYGGGAACARMPSDLRAAAAAAGPGEAIELDFVACDGCERAALDPNLWSWGAGWVRLTQQR